MIKHNSQEMTIHYLNKQRPTNQSELTPYNILLELTHLGSEAPKYRLGFKKLDKQAYRFDVFSHHGLHVQWKIR